MAPRSAKKAKTESAAKAEGAPRQPLSVPSSASWYAAGSVSAYEQTALAASGAITALGGDANYAKTRDFIVDAARQRPGAFLAATACRRALAVSDALAVVHVHAFLEAEGLINADVSAEARPVPFAPLVRGAGGRGSARGASAPALAVAQRWIAGEGGACLCCNLEIMSYT